LRFVFGDHMLDVERRELRRRGEPVAVEPQVFDLLVYLLERRDRVVSRDELIEGVWRGRIVSDSAVTTRLNAARRAVGDNGAAQAVIRTIARKGVRFIAEVHEERAAELPRSAMPPGPAEPVPVPPDPSSVAARLGDAVDRRRSARVERRLAAILAADVVGYSRLMGADDEGTLAALQAVRREVADPKIAENRGRIAKTTGDGLLVEFASVVDAVRCAVEVQTAMAERNADVPADQRIEFRIGINLGDIIIDEGDIYGDGINVAARLEALAEPGGICVSRVVRDQVRDKLDIAFEDLGEQPVKNIARPVRAHRVRLDATPEPPAVAARLAQAIWPPGTTRSRHASIMVLPFRDASAAMRDIMVISSATAFTYKGHAIDSRQIGQELGVRYLVAGSIGHVGDRVKTNIQLIDAASGAQIWGDHFDNEFVDLIAFERAVTGRIAASLDVQLVKAESRRAERAEQPDAFDLRLRATAQFYGSVAPQHTLAVRQLLQQSVALDPNSAEAWARLAEVTISDYLNRWNDAGKVQLHDAEEAVRHALRLDPDLALAHAANGLVQRAHGDHHAALEAFTRAIDLNSNFALAYAHKGNALVMVGRPGEAQPFVEQAIRLSPRDPSLGIFYWIAGRANFYAGQYDAAAPWLQKSIAVRSNLWYNRLYLVSAYALSGKLDEAKNALNAFNRHFPQPSYTVAFVEKQEAANPSNDATVVSAREKFHEGLLCAGMPAR
jgi:adenylate cyclase